MVGSVFLKMLHKDEQAKFRRIDSQYIQGSFKETLMSSPFIEIQICQGDESGVMGKKFVPHNFLLEFQDGRCHFSCSKAVEILFASCFEVLSKRKNTVKMTACIANSPTEK